MKYSWILLFLSCVVVAQQLPPTNQPPLGLKPRVSTHATVSKPSVLLTTRPKGTNKPVLFLAIESAPSAYDEYVNVEKVLVGTSKLDGSIEWTEEQHGRTNLFIGTNDGSAHFWKERYRLATNSTY